jgi:hypothetical protein
MKAVEDYLIRFVDSFVECIVWTDEDMIKEGMEERGEDPDDLDTSLENFDSASMEELKGQCEDFVLNNWNDLQEYRETGRTEDFAGQDFVLSRNGHGTGFWDRGAGDVGDRLHRAAKVYGDGSLYLGDDGRIYFQG